MAGLYTLSSRRVEDAGVLAIIPGELSASASRFVRRLDMEEVFKDAIGLDYTPTEKRPLCDGCTEPSDVVIAIGTDVYCLECAVKLQSLPAQ